MGVFLPVFQGFWNFRFDYRGMGEMHECDSADMCAGANYQVCDNNEEVPPSAWVEIITIITANITAFS